MKVHVSPIIFIKATVFSQHLKTTMVSRPQNRSFGVGESMKQNPLDSDRVRTAMIQWPKPPGEELFAHQKCGGSVCACLQIVLLMYPVPRSCSIQRLMLKRKPAWLNA